MLLTPSVTMVKRATGAGNFLLITYPHPIDAKS